MSKKIQRTEKISRLVSYISSFIAIIWLIVGIKANLEIKGWINIEDRIESAKSELSLPDDVIYEYSQCYKKPISRGCTIVMTREKSVEISMGKVCGIGGYWGGKNPQLMPEHLNIEIKPEKTKDWKGSLSPSPSKCTQASAILRFDDLDDYLHQYVNVEISMGVIRPVIAMGTNKFENREDTRVLDTRVYVVTPEEFRTLTNNFYGRWEDVGDGIGTLAGTIFIPACLLVLSFVAWKNEKKKKNRHKRQRNIDWLK